MPSLHSPRHAAVATSLVALLLATGSGASLAQDAGEAPPSPVVMPPADIEPAVASDIDEVVLSVPPLRGREVIEAVPYRAIDVPTFRAELEVLLDEEMPEALAAAEDDALTRLGLLAAGDDLRQLVLDLYADQALAYYDPRTATITIVGDLDEIGPTEAITFAHEYVHALQDQHWDLEGRRITDPTRADEILAQAALTEGDATLLMNDWAARNLKLADLLKVSAQALTRGDMRLLERLPPILRRQLVDFPYLDGLAFVNAIRAREGSWDAVDAAWEAPPVSTEQILHPERYPSDLPVEIVLPDVAAALGSGWATSYTQTLGEMQMGVWVADGKEPARILGLPGRMPRAAAVEGWDGDRLVSLDGPDGRWALVWQTAWDSQDDADEFASAARDVLKGSDGAGAVVKGADVAGGTPFPVAVLIGDTTATLEDVRAALGLS